MPRGICNRLLAQLDNLVVVADLDAAAAQHDRGRAVLLGRQFNRTLDLSLLQTTALDHEMQVDLGKHLGLFRGTLGLQKGFAAFYRLAGFLQDADHIKVAAATQTNQHHLHWPHTQVTSTALWRAIHYHRMAAARLSDKQGFACPLNTRFHYLGSAVKKDGSLAQHFYLPPSCSMSKSSVLNVSQVAKPYLAMEGWLSWRRITGTLVRITIIRTSRTTAHLYKFGIRAW